MITGKTMIAAAALMTAVAATASDPAVDFTRAAETTTGGVVSIKNYVAPRYSRSQQSNPFFNDPFFEYFFGSPRQPRSRQGDNEKGGGDEDNLQQQGLGSGVILTGDGYIVTNNHVIDGADKLEVMLNDNRTFVATVVGSDPVTDLALIKIDASGLTVIPMGDSESLKVGEWVLAVGNPFGFTSTVTAGIVSAKSRSIAVVAGGQRAGKMGIESYIQTDAAVNPGNSGGALVNRNGELVGINTAIYSQTGSYSGYSFAIPTSIVKKVVNDIKEYGSVQRALLGITIRDLDARLAKEKGITAVSEGVYVASVNDPSSARQAGIEEGDVIVAVHGVPTRKMSQLQEHVSKYRPGDKINVTYVRNNKEYTTAVTLLNSQGTTQMTRQGSMTDLGCAFRPVSDDLARSLGISGGVQVTGLKKGRMTEAGVKDGFVIIEVNGTRVKTVDDMEKIYDSVSRSDDTDRVLFITGIYPSGQRRYYAVDVAGSAE